jgi:hypothetical protein
MNIEIIEECIEKLHDTFERTDLEMEGRKIQQKLEEARYNPGAVNPLADCILSLLMAARSRGYKAGAVMEALTNIAKENINKDWKKMPDGTYRAI